VYLADQRASGVEIIESSRLGSGGYDLGNAVGGKDDWSTVGYFVQFFHEHGAQSA